MRIIYVITRSDVIGGASVHVLDLANGMKRAGNEVHILVGGEGVFNKQAESKGLSCIALRHLVREMRPLTDIAGFFELRRVIKSLKPDIVHVHSSKAGVLGRLACKTLSIPVVFTAHGWAFTEGVSKRKQMLYRLVERVMARFSDGIITVSKYDKELALKYRIAKSDLLSVVHNGMPNPSSRCSTHDKRANLRLIMVARFDEQKNHKALLHALSHLRELDWTLELVGSGPLFSSTEQLTRQLGLTDRVYFPGACTDVPERLFKADIFLLITNWEGLPLTILEAMRAGLPVIASSVGGVPEAVQHQQTGLVVERNDMEGLYNALKTLIQSEELRKEMGHAGRLSFENQFTFEIMKEKTLLVYSNALKKVL